jgi:uncharacterized protein YciI
VEHAPALNEEHWSYMDGFAAGMTARGPTLAADRATWTGSLHIVDLPDAEAAREFAEREPYNRAGLFEQHVIRRFENRLGRTMWAFGDGPVEARFVVLVHLRDEAGDHGPLPDFAALPRERLILHGDLLTPGEERPAGVVLALQAPSREAVDALVRRGHPELDERFDVEILDWEFGGRR